MATAQGMSRLVYRRGRLTEKTFTPRPGIDTVGRPGQAPGLSAFDTLSLRPGEVAQVIEVALLQPPLQAVSDDVAAGGTPGHVSITPVDAAGDVDQPLLDEWAATRGHSPAHPLTGSVMQAIVQTNVRQAP
jgi:hypothetical protein